MRLSEAVRQKLAAGEIPIIGDIKLRSPEHGDLARGRNPADIALAMVAGGVVAVSVVTEAEHYNGSLSLLEAVCSAVNVPVLRKDFVRREQDIIDTRQAGADAQLLTCCMMSENDMDCFYPVCVKADLEPLIETHSEEEIAHANRLKAGLIGINNRNIQQWEQDNGDVNRTKKLVGLVHENAVIVSESSIMTHDDVLAALKAGAHAVLIGTALLQADDIIEKMKELRGVQ
jgi:indole-3-glycerol phosphate synthase